MDNKQAFRKYLMIFDHDEQWGFYVNNLGSTQIHKDQDYPSKGHPGSYMFTWEKGRMLNEFHFVLITDGAGTFESKETGIKKINNGDGFLIFPGIWHRYKPLKKTGWTERWVGFSGELAKQFLANGYFEPTNAIIPKCNTPEIVNHFEKLFNLFNEEPFGHQRSASGICMQLMADLYNIQKGSHNQGPTISMVAQLKNFMYEKINGSIDLEQIACNMGISYSKLRLDFKKQTGISPLQYFLMLKIEKAKEKLLKTSLTQKEIAYSLGFDSDYYFNRLFKQKVGITPKQFRLQYK